MKKGFTLVELSIVLVIIGLLIGGILVGQSLIESAKINRLVSDMQQYEIAIVQFYKKFKKYPGESPAFMPAGNGDGDLDSGAGCTGSILNIEYIAAWAQLSQAKMLNKSYAAYSPIGVCPGGTHAVPYESAANAALYPHIRLGAWAETTLGSSIYGFSTFKTAAATNFGFDMLTNAYQVLPLENKLGVKSYDTSFKQVGLANINGVGSCLDTDLNPVICSAATAVGGEFHYYIAPQ